MIKLFKKKYFVLNVCVCKRLHIHLQFTIKAMLQSNFGFADNSFNKIYTIDAY